MFKVGFYKLFVELYSNIMTYKMFIDNDFQINCVISSWIIFKFWL